MECFFNNKKINEGVCSMCVIKGHCETWYSQGMPMPYSATTTKATQL